MHIFNNKKVNNVCLLKMIHVPQKASLQQTHPLFNNSQISSPLSSSKPQYLLLPGYSTDAKVHKKNACKYISPAFDNQTNNCCYIVLEGQSLQEYLTYKADLNVGKEYEQVPLTQEQIWELVQCISQAFHFLKTRDCSEYLTHFKQYCIQVLQQKNVYKLIYHDSMIAQLQAAQLGRSQWYQLYLSPEQLNGQFIPQKSIVFSFGLLLLNLCSYQNTKMSIYQQNQFKVNNQAIKLKLKIARQTNGFSKLLCNLIQSCLAIDYACRYDFQQLKDAIKRKRQRKFDQQSMILSQIMSLQKNKNLTYDLVFPSESQYSYDLNNAIKTHHKAKSQHKFHQQNRDKGHFQISEAEKSQNQQSDKNHSKVIKLKKKSNNKFQGVKIVNKNYKNEKQEENGHVQQKPLEKVQGKVQGQVDPRFMFRGTFGARNPNCQPHPQSNKNSTVKKGEERQNIISQNHPSSTNKKKPKQPQINSLNFIDSSETHPNISQFNKQRQERQSLIQNYKISIPNFKFASYNSQQPEHEEPDTPKGFGKTKPFNPFSNSNQKDSYVNSSNFKQKQDHQILPLETKMKYLSLQYCLKPVEDLIKDLGKVGVWVQGDLYYGDFVAGRRYGLGIQIFTNGEYYYGFFKEDLFCGEGLYFWSNKEYFFGYFQLGQKIYGRLQGQVQYQGQFKNNKRHGFGTCWYPSGQIYSGQWLNGKKHGNGLIIEPNGLKFKGIWVKGKRKGEGQLQMDSMTIKGLWNEEIVEGKALINYQNGDIFQGKIGKNLQKINGKYTSKSGRVFNGQFEDDQPKNGELIYSNGDKYIGELKNSKRHGYGEYYYVTGEVYKGLWQNNVKKQSK